MARLTELRAQIDAGEAGPLYLLTGDDLHSRQDAATWFQALVDPDLQAFNVQTFSAHQATTAGARDELIAAILVAARTLPMMVPRRLIYLYEGERLLSPRKAGDEDGETPAAPAGRGRKAKVLSAAEELEAYFGAPEPTTTLVIVAGPMDGNRRLVKALRKGAVAVDCGTLDSAAEAATWVRRRLEQERLAIEPSAVNALVQSTGLHLGRLRAEVEKLLLYALGERTVTVRHVRELVPPPVEPGVDFALGKAIWNGDAAAGLRELSAQFENGGQPFMILGQIRAAVGRLRPDSRIASGLEAVLRTDLALKSSTGEPQFLLERLVVELCGKAGATGRPAPGGRPRGR